MDHCPAHSQPPRLAIGQPLISEGGVRLALSVLRVFCTPWAKRALELPLNLVRVCCGKHVTSTYMCRGTNTVCCDGCLVTRSSPSSSRQLNPQGGAVVLVPCVFSAFSVSLPALDFSPKIFAAFFDVRRFLPPSALVFWFFRPSRVLPTRLACLDTVALAAAMAANGTYLRRGFHVGTVASSSPACMDSITARGPLSPLQLCARVDNAQPGAGAISKPAFRGHHVLLK